MFVSIRAYAAEELIYEVNPYDFAAGTLRGLPGFANSPALLAHERYVDELVYEAQTTSALTGEKKTFHFVLATGRYKDNRIPPKGFDIDGAADRLSEPVWNGVSSLNYFTAQEYAAGCDDVSIVIAPNADTVEISLYYQTTSREYIEFLRDEINGTVTTLPAEAYIVQTDPFFDNLKAWGDAIWDLWEHNHGLDGLGRQVAGIIPFEMASTNATIVAPAAAKAVAQASATAVAEAPLTAPTPPTLLSAEPGNRKVTLSWSNEHRDDRDVVGYAVYYDQAGKSQFLATVGLTTTFVDTKLINGHPYSYKVATLYEDLVSDKSNVLTATPAKPGRGPKPRK
jgi:hypothetical protein